MKIMKLEIVSLQNSLINWSIYFEDEKTTYKTQISPYKAFPLKLLEITHFPRYKKIGFVF